MDRRLGASMTTLADLTPTGRKYELKEIENV